MLFQPREGIEDRALPCVGIACECYGEACILGMLATALEAGRWARGTGGAGGVIRMLGHGMGDG